MVQVVADRSAHVGDARIVGVAGKDVDMKVEDLLSRVGTGVAENVAGTGTQLLLQQVANRPDGGSVSSTNSNWAWQ